MSIHRVLILGAKGTLGGQLMKLYPEAIGWDREDIDVLDFPALRAKVAGLRTAPDAVINCVAFNDVDGAEDRPEAAMALNGRVPRPAGAIHRGTGRAAGSLQHQLRV